MVRKREERRGEREGEREEEGEGKHISYLCRQCRKD
jgi:hypothetical protein